MIQWEMRTPLKCHVDAAEVLLQTKKKPYVCPLVT